MPRPKKRTIKRVQDEIDQLQKAIADLEAEAETANSTMVSNWRDSNEKQAIKLMALDRRKQGAQHELETLQAELQALQIEADKKAYYDLCVDREQKRQALETAKDNLKAAQVAKAEAAQADHSLANRVRRQKHHLIGNGILDSELSAISRAAYNGEKMPK